MFNIDNSFLLFFHSLANKNVFVDNVIIFLAEYLPFIAVILMILFIAIKNLKYISKENHLIKIKDTLKRIIFMFLPAIFSWVVATIIKYLIKRPRPFIELSNSVNPLFTHGGVDSFPSGHATFFMALAIGAFSLNKKFGWVMVIIAILIGLARIISGIHFPVDILSGFLLGILSSYLLNLLFKNKN